MTDVEKKIKELSAKSGRLNSFFLGKNDFFDFKV